MRNALCNVSGHHFSVLDAERPVATQTGPRPPDVFVIVVYRGTRDTSLRVIAELRASPITRHSRIVAVVHEPKPRLAASLLDMGANDVVSGDIGPPELSLRLGMQIRRKHMIDHLRDRVKDGLRAAMIDPLTGLYNRRFALPFVQKLIEMPRHDARPFALMVADLDHFKRINDTYGHAAGDTVLRHVASLLRDNLQGDDMVARIGGEEFLIALPDTDTAHARQRADQLCRIIGDAPANPGGGVGPIHVTVSIGVTLVRPERHADTLSVDALLKEADRALYGAKARGRNTVTYSALSAA